MKIYYPIIKAASAAFFVCLPNALTAQPGISEFYSASSEVRAWYYSLSDFTMVLGAITGILGGLRVYANWQMGKHHIDAEVMGWFFSCLFLTLISAFLRGLFGL